MRAILVSLASLGVAVGGCGDDATMADGGPSDLTSGAGVDSSGSSGGLETPVGSSGRPSEMTDSSGVVDSSDSGPDPSTTEPDSDCGNAVIDGGETCDGLALADQTCVTQGFEAGVLGCASDCSAYDTSGCTAATCGDGQLSAGEVCDSAELGGATCRSEGFDSGELECAFDCQSIDTSECGTCGNVIVDGDEVCDGLALFGQTCMSQGFDSGQLACNAECSGYDASGCGMCGNAVLDGAETCDAADLGGQGCQDVGFDSGVLACTEGCVAFETEGCGLCGNDVIDGDELCDGVALSGRTCQSEGFDSGTLTCSAACGAYVTEGCGTCGNGIVDGTESCEGELLGGATCESLGGMGGELGCTADCSYDFSGCDIAPQLFDVSAPNVSGAQNFYFRGNGYLADGDGVLLDFEVYLGLDAPCDLDFYAYEAPVQEGPYTLLARTTVTAGPGESDYAAGFPGALPVTTGMYYVLGVGWNCTATYFWDNTGAFADDDGGIGQFAVSHWDNSYPGGSDDYVPPNISGGNTVYVQRVLYAGE